MPSNDEPQISAAELTAFGQPELAEQKLQNFIQKQPGDLEAQIELIRLYLYLGEFQQVRKTALGAEVVVPWDKEPEATSVILRLKAAGYTVAALEITDKPYKVDDLAAPQFPLALVVGNEISGVDDDVMALVDLAIEIPQYGTKQSLNVSVAFGIVVMGAVQRFRKTHPTRL